MDRVERLTNLLALLLETSRPLTLVEIAGEMGGQYPARKQTLRAAFERDKAALREIGVGDLTVPKKMKKMAQGWLGRGAAYRAALDAGDVASLARSIARNVYGDEHKGDQEPVRRLARYAFAQDKAMEGLDLEGVLKGPLPFVDPASVPVSSA